MIGNILLYKKFKLKKWNCIKEHLTNLTVWYCCLKKARPISFKKENKEYYSKTQIFTRSLPVIIVSNSHKITRMNLLITNFKLTYITYNNIETHIHSSKRVSLTFK